MIDRMIKAMFYGAILLLVAAAVCNVLFGWPDPPSWVPEIEVK